MDAQIVGGRSERRQSRKQSDENVVGPRRSFGLRHFDRLRLGTGNRRDERIDIPQKRRHAEHEREIYRTRHKTSLGKLLPSYRMIREKNERIRRGEPDRLY
jgi:hypothetical protein